MFNLNSQDVIEKKVKLDLSTFLLLLLVILKNQLLNFLNEPIFSDL